MKNNDSIESIAEDVIDEMKDLDYYISEIYDDIDYPKSGVVAGKRARAALVAIQKISDNLTRRFSPLKSGKFLWDWEDED